MIDLYTHMTLIYTLTHDFMNISYVEYIWSIFSGIVVINGYTVCNNAMPFL